MNHPQTVNALILATFVSFITCASQDATAFEDSPKREVTTWESVDVKLKPLKFHANTAKVIVTDAAALKAAPNAKDFIRIGEITVRRLKEACFDGRCKQYRPAAPTDLLLARAAKAGGTHLVIEPARSVPDYVWRDSDQCKTRQQVGRESPTYNSRGFMTGKQTNLSTICTDWEQESGKGTWIETTGVVWRLDKKVAAKIRKPSTASKRPVITEVTGRYARLFCRREKCCGYKDPVTGENIGGEDNVWCSPFYRSSPRQKTADHAIIIYENRYTKTMQMSIINIHGEKVMDCHDYRKGISSGNIKCRQDDEQCFRRIEELPPVGSPETLKCSPVIRQ